jgi:Flp pilus assembly protein TadD
MTRARAAIERALALTPDLIEALLVRGLIQGVYDFDLVACEATLRRAYELAPGNPQTADALGAFLGRTGRFEEAERLVLQALELDPLSTRSWSNLAGLYRVMGRFEESIACHRKVLEFAPDRISTHHMIGYTLGMLGRYDEALAETEKEPAEWARLTGLAAGHWRAGHKAESDAALAQLVARHSDDSAFQIAAVYAIRGENDEAFRWIDHAIRAHDAGAVMVATENSFVSLRSDPRWRSVLERLGFAHLPLFKEQAG